MKAYVATYYHSDKTEKKKVVEIMFYANNKKQASALAKAYMVDFNDMNEVTVTETKSKFYIGLMNVYIKEHHGEDQLLKDEIDDINSRRRRFGLDLLTL